MSNATSQLAPIEVLSPAAGRGAALGGLSTRARVCVFGRLRVERPDGSIVFPAGETQRQLLLLLVFRSGALHQEQAVDVLWPRHSLEFGQECLSRALRRLNRECGGIVRRESSTLVLEADTDLAEYEDAVERLLSFRSAELAPDALYVEWSQPVRRRLDVLRNQLLPAMVHA